MMRESDSTTGEHAAGPNLPGVVSRRTAVAGVGAAGLAGFIAACGGDSPDPAGDAGDVEREAGESGEAGEPEAEAGENREVEDGANGDVLVEAADVPVGGGVILDDAQVVVTQPEEGDYRAFSAICTHERCVVSGVSDGQIECACHGSRFFIEDGDVAQGPAASPLPEVAITVEGDQILRA